MRVVDPQRPALEQRHFHRLVPLPRTKQNAWVYGMENGCQDVDVNITL